MRRLLALLSLVGAAACGTTVPTGSSVGTQAGDLGGATPASVASGGALPGGTTGAAPSSAVAATGTSGASVPGAVVPSAAAAPRTVDGALAPVTVGWVVLQSNSAVAGSLGFSSVATPDQTQYAQAMVDWLNAHGGLGGRRVMPLFWHMDASGSQTVDQYGTTACAFFTQDHRVDVVVDPSLGGGSSTFVQCLDAHHVPHLDTTGMLDASAADVVKHPLFLPFTGVADDSLAALEVSALAAEGFYGTSSTVGVITYDEPTWHDAVDRVLAPQLKSRTGLTLQPSNVVYLPAYSSVSDTAPISVAVSNAVLRFQAQGVNRVIFLQNFSLATVIFMTDADKQGYHPKYGLSSNDSPQTDVGLAPSGQLKNAIGYGWRPGYDVTAAQQLQPGLPGCVAIFKSKGLTFSPASAPETAAMRHCEGALLLKVGMDGTHGLLGGALVAAVERASPTFKPATVLGISLRPGHHDGVAVYRDLAYTNSCGCFRYTSGPQRVR